VVLPDPETPMTIATMGLVMILPGTTANSVKTALIRYRLRLYHSKDDPQYIKLSIALAEPNRGAGSSAGHSCIGASDGASA
jgi:hypothetical protein